jgi:hypothetical protein
MPLSSNAPTVSKTETSSATADLPQIIAAEQGFSVFYKGRSLLSRFDPHAQAEKLLARFLPAKERTLYLCPSPLFAYGLEAFLEALPDNAALLCVEADKILYEWTLGYLPPCSGKLTFVHTENPAALCRFVHEKWGQRVFRRIELIPLTGGFALAPKLYQTFADTLRHEIQIEWGNAMTLTRLGRLYIRNAIRNLPLLLSPSIASLNIGSAPVIVAGAGPSLDDWCRRHKSFEGAFVIAVDTALLPLLQRGIKPDLVVALEAQHWNLKDFAGVGGFSSAQAIPLAMDLSALPATARCLGAPPLLFWTRWTDLRIFTRLAGFFPQMPPPLPPLGSVGLSAVAIALGITSGDVITVGLDFSFTLDSYHCRGSPTHLAALRTSTRFSGNYPAAAAFSGNRFSTSSKSGALVQTDAALRQYRALFQAEFGGNPRVSDLESSGLPLGVQTLTMEEAAARFKPAVPDTQPAVPDTKPAVPDTKPAVPDTEPAVPDTKPAVPDTEPAMPDTQSAVPETKPAAVPDTKPAVPDTQLAVPDTEPAELGTKLAAVPDTMLVALPDTELPVPDTKLAVPDTKLAAVPDTKPAAVPDTEPVAVPDTKPAVPDTKPAVPDTKPAVPDTQSAVPDTKPPVADSGWGRCEGRSPRRGDAAKATRNLQPQGKATDERRLHNERGVLSRMAQERRGDTWGRLPPMYKQQLMAFCEHESGILSEILDILTGKRDAAPERLDFLLDEADYLWAHFPDCAAGGGRRPPVTDKGFLNRVRAELPPFLRLWERLSRQV